MHLSPRFKVALGGALLLAVALALLAGSSQAVDNSSRLDPGRPVEVRVNEGFDVTGTYFEDSSAQPPIEQDEIWWDLDNRTDSNPDGNPRNDKDEFNAVFHYDGFDRVGTYAFTFWVNYSDAKQFNATLVITVVENQPPIITPGLAPSGVTGAPVTFAVTVDDPDSVESGLQFSWDFDVATDWIGSSNGVPDDDNESAEKSNVQHTYTAEGTYTAKLSVTDDYGATTVAYITAIISRPPGVCERDIAEGAVGNSFTETVTVRKLCWASYHIKVSQGRHYTYTVEVTNGIPVFVMVQFGKDQFDSYKLRSSSQAYVPEWSSVPNNVTSFSLTFVPASDGIAYITIDNGYLFQLDPGHESSLTITIVDADKDNLLANVPWFVWAAIGAVAAGVVVVYAARGWAASSAVRAQEREKAALEAQEKTQARSELDMFLANPDQAMQRKTAPPPPPQPPPGAAPPMPGPAPQQRGPPRPAGPQAPAGYVPPPPQAPAPAASAPLAPAVPGFGPQPGGPQPPMPRACPSCQTPAEAGWSVCPNCGSAL